MSWATFTPGGPDDPMIAWDRIADYLEDLYPGVLLDGRTYTADWSALVWTHSGKLPDDPPFTFSTRADMAKSLAQEFWESPEQMLQEVELAAEIDEDLQVTEDLDPMQFLTEEELDDLKSLEAELDDGPSGE